MRARITAASKGRSFGAFMAVLIPFPEVIGQAEDVPNQFAKHLEGE